MENRILQKKEQLAELAGELYVIVSNNYDGYDQMEDDSIKVVAFSDRIRIVNVEYDIMLTLNGEYASEEVEFDVTMNIINEAFAMVNAQ